MSVKKLAVATALVATLVSAQTQVCQNDVCVSHAVENGNTVITLSSSNEAGLPADHFMAVKLPAGYKKGDKQLMAMAVNPSNPRQGDGNCFGTNSDTFCREPAIRTDPGTFEGAKVWVGRCQADCKLNDVTVTASDGPYNELFTNDGSLAFIDGDLDQTTNTILGPVQVTIKGELESVEVASGSIAFSAASKKHEFTSSTISTFSLVATPEPTAEPTAQPTDAPAPTEQPTDAPAPTEQPTDAPAPTEQPTEAPVPTEQPTDAPVPTEQPTDAPAPSEQPTDAPAPSEQPTDAPAPTQQPTTAGKTESKSLFNGNGDVEYKVLDNGNVDFSVSVKVPAAQGWVGLGISDSGQMPGSVAYIGLLDGSGKADVKGYNLNDRLPGSVVAMSRRRLADTSCATPSVTYENGTLTMKVCNSMIGDQPFVDPKTGSMRQLIFAFRDVGDLKEGHDEKNFDKLAAAVVPTFAPTKPPTEEESSNTGAIVGGVIGGLAALALIIALYVYFSRKSKDSVQKENQFQEKSAQQSPDVEAGSTPAKPVDESVTRA